MNKFEFKNEEMKPVFDNAQELIDYISRDDDLAKAFESMQISNSNIHIEFIKWAKPENFQRILEITKSVADGKKELDAHYPQRQSEWDNYKKLQDSELSRVSNLKDELIRLLE